MGMKFFCVVCPHNASTMHTFVLTRRISLSLVFPDSGTKFMNLNLALPTANEDESEGAEAGFVWGDQLPNLEGYDIDTLFATADAAEDFDAFESAEASFSFTFTETFFTETFLSLSYEF